MKINESVWFCKIVFNYYVITLRTNNILKIFWSSYNIDNNWKMIVEFIYIYIPILRDIIYIKV